MRSSVFVIIVAFFVVGISCQTTGKKSDEKLVSIKNEFGEIKVKLFDETPEHKNNFLKLVSEGFYNDLLFHRVIENFMIQGGDPESKNAQPGARLGGGGPDYTLPAEFVPEYFHKKGALAAARTGGPSNPEKRSSGSQFYIVQGKIFRHGELDTMAIKINQQRKDMLLREKLGTMNDELNAFKEKNDREGFNLLLAETREKVDSTYAEGAQFTFSPEQRETYTTIGGYPSLDGEYTIFGEVVEGLEVLDKIAAVEVDQNNRPLMDVKMKIELTK
jgi:peptidyl-prolyl cis-trans isomerase B (cyclophilin B)